MLNYRVIRSHRKTIALQVSAAGEVTVRAPLQAPAALIEEFVVSKKRWLQRTQRRLAARPKPLPLTLGVGDEVPYLGAILRLQWGEVGQAAQRSGGSLILPQGPLSARKAALIAWYQQAAKPLFTAVVDEHFAYFSRLGYQRPKLYIKNMKTRWGSMSSRGNMSLNVALVQLPMLCIHHIVVHELCHLVHMNHSGAFYALLEARFPRWREADAIMKNAVLLPLVDSVS